ncbi:hypothetical protein D3C73_1214680 [compost metagenome]
MNNRRKSNKNRRSGPRFKNGGTSQIADIFLRLKLAKSTGSSGVNDTLWNTLAFKALKLLNQMPILQQRWPIRARRLGVLIISNRGAIIVGHLGICICLGKTCQYCRKNK